jgi:hypothetical protein
MSPHWLRRTFSERMVEVGIERDVIGAILGRAVDLLLEVMGQAVSSPRPSRPDVVKWASDFAPSVERLRARRRERS